MAAIKPCSYSLISDLDCDSQSLFLLAYLNSRTYVIMSIHDIYVARAIATVSLSLCLSCSLLIAFSYDLVCCLVYFHLDFVSPDPGFHLFYHFL